MADFSASRGSPRVAGVILRAMATATLLLSVGCAVSPLREERPISGNAAVVGWTQSARELRGRKQFDEAAARLERALRAEPGNAYLWHELALVHMEQGNLDQAIQFAYKSNALAGDDRLKTRNRRLVDRARTARDKQGPAAADPQ